MSPEGVALFLYHHRGSCRRLEFTETFNAFHGFQVKRKVQRIKFATFFPLKTLLLPQEDARRDPFALTNLTSSERYLSPDCFDLAIQRCPKVDTILITRLE